MFHRTIFVCLAVSSLAGAATLGGRVYDPSGAVIPGARVFAYDDKGASQMAGTSPDGQYSFQNLSPGAYRLEVQAPGFAIFDKRNIQVAEGQQPRVDAAMRVGVIMETMRVEAQGFAARSQTPQRIRVGGNVKAARLLKQTRPVYPDSAKARGAAGVVLLRTVILMDGSTAKLIPSADSDPELAEAAMQAVKQWKYQPTLLNGQPVETETTISIQFDLK
jgi:TonB family protein